TRCRWARSCVCSGVRARPAPWTAQCSGAAPGRLARAAPGRPSSASRPEIAMPLSNVHHVHGRPIRGAFPGMERVGFGMGCFWGAGRLFWSLPGVETTAVGYAGGHADAPDYRQVCSGRTGHAEVVLVVYDPAVVGFDA